MDKKLYKIEIDGKASEYVRGRISGMISALSTDDRVYAQTRICELRNWPWEHLKPTSWEIRMNATSSEFTSIKDTINKFYPNLCMFYVLKD